MSDDLRDLFHDAVSGVVAQPATPALANRLAAVDRRRKLTVMVAGAATMVAGTFGVAAAWPEHQSPIRLEIIGDETDVDEAAVEDPAVENEAEVLPIEVEPTPTPDGEPEAEDDAAHDSAFELDWGATFELAPIATPTPVPQLVPQQPAPDDGGHQEQQHQQPTPEPQHEPEHQSEPQERHEEPEEQQGEGGESGSHAFSASALYGSCEEPIPYDVYSGTAAPGAAVTVSSPYSATTSTTADSSGHWSVQVTFEAAPVGEHFTVTVSSGGESVGLGFVRTG